MVKVFSFWINYVDGFYLKHLDKIQVDSEDELYVILTELRSVLNTKLTKTEHFYKLDSQSRKILICSNDFIVKRHKLMLNHDTNPLTFNGAESSSTTNINVSKMIEIHTYFELIDFQLNININKTETIRDQVNAVYLNAPKSFPWILWSVGDVTTSRLATRIGNEYVLTSAFLLTMLPGTISIFYGDEIGLQDTIITSSNKVTISLKFFI